VLYRGARAPAAATPVPASMSACGKSKTQNALVLGADRALANVMVSVPDVPNAPKPPARDTRVEQKGCEYLPHVQFVPVGSPVLLVNADATLHNVHARRGDNTIVDLAMPLQGQQLKAPPSVTSRPGMVTLKCDAGHTWMSAYMNVVDTPFAAVTDKAGTSASRSCRRGSTRSSSSTSSSAPSRAPSRFVTARPRMSMSS
jgi:hypothetical protein